MFTEATQCRVLMQHLGGKKKEQVTVFTVHQTKCVFARQTGIKNDKQLLHRDTNKSQQRFIYVCQVSAMSPKYIK